MHVAVMAFSHLMERMAVSVRRVASSWSARVLDCHELNVQDLVVVLDERGKDATSEGLARLLAKVICRAVAFEPCDGPTPVKLSLIIATLTLIAHLMCGVEGV